MPSQQLYSEAPGDVFNPVVNQLDWLEIITSDSSPGESSFNQETQEASLIGYIPWNKQRSAVAYFLGYATVTQTQSTVVVGGPEPPATTNIDGSTVMSLGTNVVNYPTTPVTTNKIQRFNPQAHPIFPWLYCSDVALKPFNPMVNPLNPGSPLQFVSPWFQSGNDTVSLNIANHRLAVCHLKFRNYRMSFLDDSVITDPRMEWMRNVYMDIDPKVEALSADGVGQLMFCETGPAGNPALKTPFPAPLAELLGKATFKLNWLNVPYFYLTSVADFFFPANIMACLGTVNSQPFPYGSSTPFQPETLLFDSVEFKQKTFPVPPADPSSPILSIDVAMTMHYFNPPMGATNPIAFGHNNMPWRGKPGDPVGGKFFRATRGGGTGDPPLLQTSDFNQMFLSAM